MYFEFETTIENAPVVIAFNYQPEEEMVRYYSDGSGYPGCSASVEDISVHYPKRKFNSLKMEWEDIQIDITDLIQELGFDVEELCFEHVNNHHQD